MTTPIRILHITYKMHCAGIETFIMNMYRHIDRTQIQFDFLVHYSQPQFYDDEIEKLGGRIYRFSVREDNNFIKYFKDLGKFFREHKEYTIVHAHMESFAMFYLPFVKKAGIPVIIAHSHIDKADPNFKGFIKNLMNQFFKYLATDYMACSEEAAKFLFGNKKCFILRNAIDTDQFDFNEKIRSKVRVELGLEGKFVVGHIGRFNIVKNHSFLIDIFYKISLLNENAILLLIGEGILEKDIKDKVAKYSLADKVQFMGVIENVNDLYQAMDVFVLPSLYEGLGIVGIEAQTSGLKCICSDGIPPIAQITSNMETLSLSESSDVWAAHILNCSDGYERKSMKQAIVNAGFDILEAVGQLQDFYSRRYQNLSEENLND